MSTVVIRCPNCGTTQSTLGECDACHHESVGYFCTNHASGRFIDGPRCPTCGATFGAAMPAARPEPPRRTPPPAPSAPVEWGPPPRRARPEDVPVERPPEWIVLEPRGEDIRDPRMDPRYDAIDPTVAARAVARGAMGCAGRIVMMLVVLILLAILMVGGFVSGAFGAETTDQGGRRPPCSCAATIESTNAP